ncbi:uric acid degradation bifunctional protein TTL-like [Iris pallida]|uniref:Uric acid degradation bifunctional protein TTL-like n=1 Tax=Iris pallida TaxID=29817 RepID=A0AAX6H3W8_IRIPA|nr:uric acid degradation bifunctional protein TTL-like [Iris pallida]
MVGAATLWRSRSTLPQAFIGLVLTQGKYAPSGFYPYVSIVFEIKEAQKAEHFHAPCCSLPFQLLHIVGVEKNSKCGYIRVVVICNKQYKSLNSVGSVYYGYTLAQSLSFADM